MIHLEKVEKENEEQLRFMYDMLKERDNTVTISFEMPSWIQHVFFVKKNEYQAWYIIKLNDMMIGNIYLNTDNSFGYFIKKEYQNKGLGTMAVQELTRLHPREEYFAHINPDNERAIHQAKDKFKGKLVQITYRMTGEDIRNPE